MEITQTATYAVLFKATRVCVTLPEAEAVAYAEKLGKDYSVVPVEAWLGGVALNKTAPAPTKAAPAPKTAPAVSERFQTVPNGFGGTTTVKAVDVPQAPVDDFAAQEARMVALVQERFTEAKLEVTDITAEMRAFATVWAKRWTGDFVFMVDMRTAAKRGTLSVGQAKGTMNCFRADVLRTIKSVQATPVAGPVAEPTTAEVPDSRYALETEQGEVIFYQATTYRGRRYLKRLIGAPGDFVKYPIANAVERASVWAKIQANPARAAKLFSRKHTVCARCAAPLSDPCSRATGFGPDCSDTLGVHYVSDKAEALRILREEGVSLEGLLMEALAADGESI